MLLLRELHQALQARVGLHLLGLRRELIGLASCSASQAASWRGPHFRSSPSPSGPSLPLRYARFAAPVWSSAPAVASGVRASCSSLPLLVCLAHPVAYSCCCVVASAWTFGIICCAYGASSVAICLARHRIVPRPDAGASAAPAEGIQSAAPTAKPAAIDHRISLTCISPGCEPRSDPSDRLLLLHALLLRPELLQVIHSRVDWRRAEHAPFG